MKLDGFGLIVRRFFVCALSVFLLVGIGCSTTKKKEQVPEETDEKKAEIRGPAPIYYDFEDILIPADLSLVKKKSFIYSTPGFSAGVLVFKGRVTGDSLANFFSSTMPKDGWLLRSSFRYENRVILNFDKGERNCLVVIVESTFDSQVEIWVAPQVAAAMP